MSFGIFGISQQFYRDGGVPKTYLESRLHGGKKYVVGSVLGNFFFLVFSLRVLIAINVAATNLGKKTIGPASYSKHI